MIRDPTPQRSRSSAGLTWNGLLTGEVFSHFFHVTEAHLMHHDPNPTFPLLPYLYNIFVENVFVLSCFIGPRRP